MALLLSEAVQFDGYNGLEAAVIKMFMMESPILEELPFVGIEGDSYTYRTEASLPSVEWRVINGTYSDSAGTINPKVERLFILGGEVKIDRFILATQGKGSRGVDIKAYQYRMKAQAMSNEFDTAFFEGDDLVNPNQMVGMRRRLTGGQVLLQGSGGAALTLAKLDQLLDTVVFPNKRLYMNRTLRRKLTELVTTSGTGTSNYQITTDLDGFGRQITKYNGVPIRIVELKGDMSTILDFDEDPGDGASDTASVYCLAFGEDAVHGLYNGNNKVATVEDFGEQESAPVHMGRVEAYYGLCVKHGRGAGRLRGILNS
jgi:hypothetical protein